MTRSNMNTLAGLAVIALIAATSGQVLAEPRTRPPSLEPAVTVKFADLNVSSPAGARVLYARIRTAAQQVCGPSFSLWDGRRWARWKECYSATVDAAVNKVNRPMLTDLHRQHTEVARR